MKILNFTQRVKFNLFSVKMTVISKRTITADPAYNIIHSCKHFFRMIILFKVNVYSIILYFMRSRVSTIITRYANLYLLGNFFLYLCVYTAKVIFKF